MDTEGEASPCLVLAGVINISQNTNSLGWPGQTGWIIQQYRFFTAGKNMQLQNDEVGGWRGPAYP